MSHLRALLCCATGLLLQRPGPAPASAPPPPLSVVSAGPRGRTDGAGTIHVRFNQPVVALGSSRCGEDAHAEALLRISPKVGGCAYFASPELLVFEPRTLAPAQEYRVTLEGPVTTLSGARYAGPLSFTFETPRPRVVQAFPAARSTDQRRDTPVVLQFLHPVAAAEVAAHVRVRAAQPLPVRVAPATAADIRKLEPGPGEALPPGLAYTVRPQGLWPVDSEITVEVTAGLRGRAGPLPMDQPFSLVFRTHPPLRLTSASCAPPQGCGLEPLTLRFSNPITNRQLGKIRITPRPRDLSTELLDIWSDAEGAREVTLRGVFLPGTTYEIRLDGGLTDIYGQRLGQAVVQKALVVRRPSIQLSSPAGTLLAGRPRTVGVLTRHVQALEVRAAVLPDDELAGLLLAERRDQKLPWPSRLLPVAERRFPLSPTGPTDWSSQALDLAELAGGARRAILIEVRAAALVPAAAGEAPPEPVRGLFRVTDLGPLAVSAGPGALVAVMRLSSGQPVQGATVRQHFLDRAPVDLGQTDAAGLLHVPGLAWAGSGRSLLSISGPADDRAYLPIGAGDALWHPPPERPGLRRGERLIAHLVTERGAYLPGDRVRAVGWAAVDTPYTPSGLRCLQEGAEVRFELHDPKDRVVSAGVARTTREGKFWAELPVPEHGSLGSHRVVARLAGEEVTSRVRVEDFRVPEFLVLAAAEHEDVLSGQTTRVRVSASYYFGGPVKIARATQRQSCTAAAYRPPGLPATWTVGEPIPWDLRERATKTISLPVSGEESASGRLVFATGPDRVRFPGRCQVSVQIQDPSYQSIGAEITYRVHPARFYLAVDQPGEALYAGERVALPLRAVLPGGARTAAAGVRVRVERV
jgi:hypothetical protein